MSADSTDDLSFPSAAPSRGEPPRLQQDAPATDPFWLSAIRGRVLAAASAGFTAWLSAEALWRALVAAWSGGGWAGAVAAVEQAGVALDAGAAFGLALAGLVGLAASIASKVREWLGARKDPQP